MHASKFPAIINFLVISLSITSVYHQTFQMLVFPSKCPIHITKPHKLEWGKICVQKKLNALVVIEKFIQLLMSSLFCFIFNIAVMVFSPVKVTVYLLHSSFITNTTRRFTRYFQIKLLLVLKLSQSGHSFDNGTLLAVSVCHGMCGI